MNITQKFYNSLTAIGCDVTASDISAAELSETKRRAADANVSIRFARADFCTLSEVFSEQFDIVIARTWSGDCCRLTQYIIDDEHTLEVNKFEW